MHCVGVVIGLRFALGWMGGISKLPWGDRMPYQSHIYHLRHRCRKLCNLVHRFRCRGVSCEQEKRMSHIRLF